MAVNIRTSLFLCVCLETIETHAKPKNVAKYVVFEALNDGDLSCSAVYFGKNPAFRRNIVVFRAEIMKPADAGR
jgi:hypothetical protein